MATEAQRDLATLAKQIETFKKYIETLEEKYKAHTAHLEIAEEERIKRLQRLAIPESLKDEWKSLTDIVMSDRYIQPYDCYGGGGGGYTELKFILSFSDGRSFEFYTTESMLGMRSDNYDEFGWAPGNLSGSVHYPTATKLWHTALDHDRNRRKHICCAIATFIYYLSSRHQIPWNLKELLAKNNIADV